MRPLLPEFLLEMVKETTYKNCSIINKIRVCCSGSLKIHVQIADRFWLDSVKDDRKRLSAHFEAFLE